MELYVKDSEESEILPYKCSCHTIIDIGEDSGIKNK